MCSLRTKTRLIVITFYGFTRFTSLNLCFRVLIRTNLGNVLCASNILNNNLGQWCWTIFCSNLKTVRFTTGLRKESVTSNSIQAKTVTFKMNTYPL